MAGLFLVLQLIASVLFLFLCEVVSDEQDAGYSCQKLSLLAGLPKNAIYRIELNQARYTYPIRARAIANALHCKVEDIFTITEGA